MMKFTLWLVALAMIPSSVVAFSGCEGLGEVVGSGILITQEYDTSQMDLSEFTMVAVEDGIQVSITQSDNWSLSITIDDNMLKHFVIDTEGYALKLGLEETLTYRNVTVKAIITTPVLLSLSLYEGSAGTIDVFNPLDNLRLKLTQGSQLTGSIVTANCQLDLSDGSTAQLFGSGVNLIITASDGSVLDLTDFLVSDGAEIYLSNGTKATISVQGELSGKLRDGSHLFYYDKPALGPIECSGGSTVEQIGNQTN